MPTPTYIRSGSDSSFPSASDSRDETEETTGLRQKPVYLLIGYLIFLAILATFLLIMNIMLIVHLRMNTHGMKSIRFHKLWNPETGEVEKVVHFTGEDIDLGSVLTNGKVYGYPEQDLNVYGSRVILTGEQNETRLILEDDGCKIKNVDNFQIVSIDTGRPIFSALHPLVTIDKRIKKISTSKIVTNKIRSPVDENLRISVQDLSIRGNEGIRLEANAIEFGGVTGVTLNTSRDGKLHLSGAVRIGTSSKSLPKSPSPSLAASIDAFRVCVCNGIKPKIYLVPGNKPCMANSDVCS